jgi:hypothetical protein
MENKNSGTLSALIGILGVGVIILSIILITYDNAGQLFRGSIISLLQADLGVLLLIYGIRENRSKGKPKGNMYFIVGLAILTTTAFTIYNLFMKLAE